VVPLAGIEFFTELALELEDEWTVQGRWVDRVVGLEGVDVQYAMMPGLRRRFAGPRARIGHRSTLDGCHPSGENAAERCFNGRLR
jgi:hypothetical protein